MPAELFALPPDELPLVPILEYVPEEVGRERFDLCGDLKGELDEAVVLAGTNGEGGNRG